jgi:hypothetical protein
MSLRTGLHREGPRRNARLFVIATEGTYTEPDYFHHLKDERLVHPTRVEIHTLETPQRGPDAGHSDPASVLQRLAKFHDEGKAEGRITEIDELWLVVDVDRHEAHLDQVVAAAAERGFHAAVSNPCIELWLLLHHGDDTAGITCCKDCEDRLRAKLGAYNKASLDTQPYTKPAILRAIDGARKLDGDGSSLWPRTLGSHVYKLIEALFASP